MNIPPSIYGLDGVTRLVVNPGTSLIEWGRVLNGDVTETGKCVNFQEIREVQTARNIESVIVDDGCRPQECYEAAHHYGWRTYSTIATGRTGVGFIAKETTPAKASKPQAENPLMPVSQSRKYFHDWLDQNRPWAKSSNAYDFMELMVEAAAFAFRGDVRPTKAQVSELEAALNRFTSPLDEHPEGYEGPCMCAECRSEMAR